LVISLIIFTISAVRTCSATLNPSIMRAISTPVPSLATKTQGSGPTIYKAVGFLKKYSKLTILISLL
jgi:hypothetical protein